MTRQLLAPAGWLLVVASAAWLSSASEGAEPQPTLWLVAGAASTLALGLALPRPLAPIYGLVVSTAVAVVVVAAPGGLSGAPLAAPLGYANANGALCAQGAAAAVLALLAARGAVVRLASSAVAATLVGLAWATGSAAGFGAALACCTVPALLALPRRNSRWTPVLCRVIVAATATATALVVLLTLGLAAAYDPEAARVRALERAVDSTLSERRVALWSEALQMAAEQPLTGVGVGRFAAVSATARGDADARWAHSGYLELAAETGFPGLLGLLGLLTCLFCALWRSCGRGVLAAVGACAAAAVAGHAAIDYVLHFWPVPLLALATVGVALGHDLRNADEPVSGSPRHRRRRLESRTTRPRAVEELHPSRA